ncbi:hypothetical protein JTE90_028207 [Oedothorax gibbosus]|uniref:Speckle-type POZ protein n=1 Tax=Oedothorax gibbosus TaxID=931172 RepID=A0AAV6U0A9_9ARAC|nr:hypothetical protein JTE90_028207 [Oedothorax gibbosus]
MSENLKEIQSRTIIPTESCKFTWSIENFSLCGLQGEEYLNSPMFTTGTSLLTTWYLILIPNGTKGFLEIYLAGSSTESSAHYASFEISIIDSNQTKCYVQQWYFLFQADSNMYGSVAFVPRSVLFGQSGLLPGDILTVMCELKTSKVDDYKISETKLKEISKPTTSNAVFKKLDSLAYDFRQLYDTKMFTDFTLKVGEEEFKVHKIILCARSSVFNTMLNCEMQEKLTNCVKITDFDASTVRMMLHYIYCGEVEGLTSEISIQLYSAAEKYNLQDLKDICVEYLSNNISVDNFCDVLALGALHNVPELMTATRNFFGANAAVIKETEKWPIISKTYPDLVIAMYEFILSKIKI